MLLIGSFELAPGSGIVAILAFHKMDALLVGSELTKVPRTLGKGRFAGADAKIPPSPLHLALLLNACLGWAAGACLFLLGIFYTRA